MIRNSAHAGSRKALIRSAYFRRAPTIPCTFAWEQGNGSPE